MATKQPMSNSSLGPNAQSRGSAVQTSSANQENDDLHLRLDYFDDGDDEFEDDEDDYYEYSYSDGEYESDVTLEEAEGGGLDLKRQSSQTQLKVTVTTKTGGNGGACTDLVPVGEAADDPYNVDSEEENELLRGIKDEIKDMVRTEMQSELAFYEHKVKAIEAGRLPSATEGGREKNSKYPDLANMEPELREAYIKMYKLDCILAKRVKKEREVKRERILLERRIRDEINNMQSLGRIQRDIKANTDRYLSLTLPPSHNEGVVVDEPSVTPVFQTQVNEQDLQGRGKTQTASASINHSARTVPGSRQSSAASSQTNATGSQDREASSKHGHGRKRKKDFIKRNKELAANANDVVVMTDDEKKRLQDLLTDIDALPDIPEEGVDSEVNDPYQVVIHPGEGFLPSDAEFRTLSSIDQRLQSILPEEEFRSIASSSLSSVPQQRLFMRVGVHSNLDYEMYGERALIETKEEREFQAKLKQIEEQLEKFHNDSDEKVDTPPLTEEQLDSLLNDCVWSMSRISAPPDTPHSIDSDRSLESARAQLMQNPPKLSEEQLQKLLSEAHFPLSTRLLALQDDDSKSAQCGENGGVIRAETWKAIADETLSDEEGPSSMPTTSSVFQRSTYPSVRPSFSETSVHPQISRHALRRSGSQTSDSDGRDSRVSLPEICSSPLINTRQGQGVSGAANNDPMSCRTSGRNGARMTASLDNMVYNDLSASGLRNSSSMSGGMHQLSGTPLLPEDVGSDQGQATPVPHPPPSPDRQLSSGSSVKARFGQ